MRAFDGGGAGGMHLHTRTKGKAADSLASGALWRDSPAEVARHADIIFTMVGFPRDVEEVYFGADGILAGAERPPFPSQWRGAMRRP
uniref:NAD binding domain of 6-phosphogluconate dehydrogenase n=1 Tax=Candidatus Kentrum sp. TC TaxID=2126339 RepID=A0A450YK43_9GAMM|nr:MAG: NAD binding domain of 6-phosphogluconate dehydrogenase [Candidatus Kentron sp. TC]